jgi:hypothetical protein
MFTHPHLASEFARERQRDMLAQADQQRLVRQFRDLAKASRRAERAQRRTTRSLKRSRPAVLPS